jgi:outer membrane protein
MFPRMRAASFAILAVLILVVAAVGQDRKPVKTFKFTAAQDIPIPTEKKGLRTIDLTLADALRVADVDNADLDVFRLGPQRSAFDVIIAKAFYDSEVYSDAGINKQENPSLTTFDTNREIYDARLGWRKRMLTGALVDVSVSGIKTTQSERRVGAAVFSPAQTYDTSLNLSVTQPLLRSAWWEYGEADIHRAESARSGAQHQYEQTRQDTLLEVARAFWEFVFARADYRVKFQARELAQEQLRITEARIAARDLAARDKVADEAEVARQQEALIVAENQIREREDNLRALLFKGRTNQMWNLVLRPTTNMVPDLGKVASLRWENAAKAALARRPELERLRNNITVAEQLLVISRGDLWPQLDLVGSYNSGAQRLDNLQNTLGDTAAIEYPDWSLRLEFSYPLGNRAAAARRDRAMLDVEDARRQVIAEEIVVRREVRAAVRNMKTLAESIRASGESVRLAASDLDTAQHKQRVGTLTPFDVHKRNQELQDARSRLHRNHVDFRISEAVLDHAQGKLRAEPKSGSKGR